MKKTALLLTALSILMLNACTNIGFNKTKSGLEYKIISGSEKGDSLKHGDIVKFEYRITFKDSMVMNSYDFMPVYDQVDSVGRFHDFSEFLTKMKVGDSAVSYQIFDTLEKNSQFGVPPYMKKGDKQQMTIKVTQVFKAKDGKLSRDFAIEDYNKEMDKYKAELRSAVNTANRHADTAIEKYESANRENKLLNERLKEVTAELSEIKTRKADVQRMRKNAPVAYLNQLHRDPTIPQRITLQDAGQRRSPRRQGNSKTQN